jgi:hypothetical protein
MASIKEGDFVIRKADGKKMIVEGTYHHYDDLDGRECELAMIVEDMSMYREAIELGVYFRISDAEAPFPPFSHHFWTMDEWRDIKLKQIGI